MTEKELLEKLAQFQQIKPNNDWANWCLNNILSQKPASDIKSEAKQSWKPKITLVAFDIIRKYRVALATSALMVIFVSTFALAQTSLPNSPLYTLKTLTQDIRLALTPQEQKPLVKMQIAEARLNDLAQVKDLNNKKEIIAQQIKKDLETVPQDLKKLPVRKDTLAISQKVQEKSSDLSKTLQNLNLENNTKDSLSKTLAETQNEVLAVITETSEKINNCPTYLNEELNTLQKTILENPQLFERWSASDLAKIKSDLIDATNDLKADNCLEAMAKIESINQLMQIHSLEDTTTSTTK